MCRCFLFFALVLFCAFTLCAQPYSFKHYQVENGLSNNAVVCSLQDERGFLWFGTKDGLNRFDGYTFKIFRHDAADATSIGNNFIQTLYGDEDGTLWIGTERGLYKYDELAEGFQAIKATSDFQISELTADTAGNLWFVDGLTLYRYGKKKGALTAFDPQVYFEATGICLTPEGVLWASTSNGYLQRFDAQKNSFDAFYAFSKTSAGTSRWIEKIQPAGKGKILVGTGSAGLKIFDTQSFTTRDIALQTGAQPDLFVRNFLQTAPDEFWIGTEAGIFVYNSGTGQSVNLRKKYNDPFSLSDNAVYTFCRDKEGGVWAGTYFGGVNYYPKQYTPFRKAFPKAGENSLSGNVVREIRKDSKGALWIGTEDAGLNKWDAAGTFTHFSPSAAKGSLSYSNIHGLLLTGDELWVGTFEHGLDVMNINTGKVVRHYGAGPGKALRSNFIYTIHQTKAGEIYIGTTIGLYRYNRGNDDFDPVPGMPLYNWYTSILEDAAGVLWTTTYGSGINYLDTKTGKSGNLRHNAADKYSLSSNRVNAVFEDSDKNLWFATEDGLCKWNPDTKNFIRYGTANGFPSNFMMSILEDDKKGLWISTTKGLVCFQPATAKLQVFTIANGLLSDQFNFSSAYKDEDGRMYFGSAKGLVSFQPSAFTQTTFTPPVYITGFQVNNKDMVIGNNGSPLKKAITFTKNITLSHGQATFSIDFAALSYTAPEMLEYAYKMTGLSGEWIYLKKNRKVYFTELAPGRYTFNVKATSSSGVWSGRETSLAIVILPPWWRSWWAYGLYALCLLLAIAYFIRRYHNRVQEKARRNFERLEIAKEKEIYEAKMEFFTAVAHEIRTPLTLIKGPLEKVMRKAGGIAELQTSLKIMDRNTARLVELTNQLLDFRQTEIAGFSLSFVNAAIPALLDDAHQSFTALAEQKGLRFSLRLPAEPVEAYVDEEAFRKIIYNLYSNAVKYAGSCVEVELCPLAKNSTAFSILVKNDGYLITASLREKIFEPFYRIKETEKQKGTGIGLALSRSLAQLHKGSLVLKEPDNGMNVFLLTLPLHQEIEFTLASKTPHRHHVSKTNFKP